MKTNSSERAVAERLKGVPLFANASAKQRRTLSKLGKVLTWKEGSVPIGQGGKGAAFFLLLDGGVDVSRDGTTLARLGEGDFVGEIALLTNEKRNATVTVTEDSTVFALGRPALAAALRTDPAMGLALLEAMGKRQQAIQ